MNKFFMLVGISGSGKSYCAHKYFKEEEIFSSDALRKELLGNENDQSQNNLIFNELHKRIVSRLKDNKTVCYDATNLSARRRISFLRTIKNIDCEKICVVLTATIKQCIKNDKKRKRQVGEQVILNQVKKFFIPIKEEGWDKVLFFNPFGINVINIDSLFLNDTPHDCQPYHYETIEEHCVMSSEIARKNNEPDDIVTVLLYHDIGKLFTKDFKDREGNDTKIAHYYGHENYSTYLYMTSNNTYDCFSDNIIMWLINNHMRPYQQGYEKWRRQYSDELIHKLEKVHKYDKLGRITYS